MSAPHIDDDLLDQFALGSLRRELLPSVEEHLLICPHCQARLIAADEFIGLFRAAATQPDARPLPSWWRPFNVRVPIWASAAAVLATVFLFISVEYRKPPMTPATVFMQALRGPESGAAITAGKPARIVFDLTPTGAAGDYEVEIVNLLGTQVLSIPMEFNNGRPSILIRGLESGSYWIRIHRRANRELIAEYGLRTE